jgi:hypothetical protein
VKVAAVAGFPQTLRVAVPEGFAFSRVSADGASVEPSMEASGRVLALAVSSGAGGTVSLSAEFSESPARQSDSGAANK